MYHIITKFILVCVKSLTIRIGATSINQLNKGSGNTTEEEMWRWFQSIEVSNAIDLVIEQSDVTGMIWSWW
jgi:hypothetical protein